MPRLSIGSINFGSSHDLDWFVVVSRLGVQGSVRANISSIIGFYLQRQKAKYKETLAYEAAKHGITPSECFYRILHEIPYTKELPEGTVIPEVPELNVNVPNSVAVDVPIGIYEILRTRAEQEGVTVAKLLENRFTI